MQSLERPQYSSSYICRSARKIWVSSGAFFHHNSTLTVLSISSSCKKCDPVEIELGGETYQAQQSTSCSEFETCYTYNRDKCYTTTFPYLYHGEMKNVKAVLTPASCYAD